MGHEKGTILPIRMQEDGDNNLLKYTSYHPVLIRVSLYVTLHVTLRIALPYLLPSPTF